MKVSHQQSYPEKFNKIAPQTLFAQLSDSTQSFVKKKAHALCFTQQELREVCQMANDLFMWKEPQIEQLWSLTEMDKKSLFVVLRERFESVQSKPKSYADFSALDKPASTKPNLVSINNKELGLGYCPVASQKTRCCNLLTLDAVQRCGFDCSYCSIQSFYHQNEVRFDADFAKKLANLDIDPDKLYHIGTGQSSDSLMWGNHNENLAVLCEFAAANRNVILEFKTKSKNIVWLLDNDYPANVICTWSLNPQDIIDYEEHQTASLRARINSARKIADKGRLVGFHFHPMVWFEDSTSTYAEIAKTLQHKFSAHEVAMISMGSLTYNKDVMRRIRRRKFKSKILQMPYEQVAGKYAYPERIKKVLFSGLYNEFSQWHDKVFFYLCMEHANLWPEVFGHEVYKSNTEFEMAMKQTYLKKIGFIENG